MTVFSNDSMIFVRDTRKEDKEDEVKASWEEEEPGRAKLASESRRRFLLQKKIKQGYTPTEEEKELLNKERVRKVTSKEPVEDKKKGKKKDEPVEDEIEEKYQIAAEKDLSKSLNNKSKQIQEFVNYCTAIRVQEKTEGEVKTINSDHKFRRTDEISLMHKVKC